jgi:hypothetical protein
MRQRQHELNCLSHQHHLRGPVSSGLGFYEKGAPVSLEADTHRDWSALRQLADDREHERKRQHELNSLVH